MRAIQYLLTVIQVLVFKIIHALQSLIHALFLISMLGRNFCQPESHMQSSKEPHLAHEPQFPNP